MARLISTTVDQLMSRTRQTGGLAIEQDLATKILTICQQIVNINLREVTATTTVSLTANTQLYSLGTILPSAADVIDVYDSSGRRLVPCKSLHELSALAPSWYDVVGTRFEAWSQIGRDYIIVYPAQASSVPLTFDYVVATTVYDNYSALSGINMALPDDQVELALKLAEVVLLLRARDATLIESHIRTFWSLLEAHHAV